jgi:hypothetical protein
MSIIRLFVINNLIFSSCQGCRDILREHIKISLYLDGFNIILVDSSMTQRVEVGTITVGRIKECPSIFWRWLKPWLE